MCLHLLSKHFSLYSLAVCVSFVILSHGTHTAILPYHFIIWRHNVKYNPLLDIRRNLFIKNNTKLIPTFAFSYYKIKSTTYPSRCHHFQLPILGDIICVECQNIPYFKTQQCKESESIFSKTYFYHALNSYCHGEWFKITETIVGNCPTYPSYVVIKRDV